MSKNAIDSLIKILSKMPGLGYRSAKRITIHLLMNAKKSNAISDLIRSLQELEMSLQECRVCHNIDLSNPCAICSDNSRNFKILCIIEQISDVWAMERGGHYRGVYHILGGALSAIDGVSPDDLNLGDIPGRIADSEFDEVIIATNPTIEGKITTSYICDILSELDTDCKITRLAYGIPIGGEMEYLDEHTIEAALSTRVELNEFSRR